MKLFLDWYQTKRDTSSPSMQWQNSGTECSGYQRFAGVQKADRTDSWKKNTSRAVRPSEIVHLKKSFNLHASGVWESNLHVYHWGFTLLSHMSLGSWFLPLLAIWSWPQRSVLSLSHSCSEVTLISPIHYFFFFFQAVTVLKHNEGPTLSWSLWVVAWRK